MKKSLYYFFAFMALAFTACSDDNDSPAYIPPVGSVNMTEMCHHNGVLYGFLSEYDADWNVKIVHSSYNTFTGAVAKPWITDETKISSPFKMFSVNDYICISTSDYVNDGDVNIFTEDGRFLTNFTTGVGPRKGVSVDDNIYVLCEGLWGYNNSVLTKYNLSDNSVVKDCFMDINGIGLGDTANDICVYGNKMYITVATDKIIWVTDKEANVIKKMETEGQPRYLAATAGKVYATYYNGKVARIDTTSCAVEATVAVGRNPEQLCVANNKLFVANSGGLDYPNYDKTVSVVDIPSFTELEKIDVAMNPANILTADNGLVYLVSLGNYGDVPNALQCINPYSHEVIKISE